jgi:hypothetical protein
MDYILRLYDGNENVNQKVWGRNTDSIIRNAHAIPTMISIRPDCADDKNYAGNYKVTNVVQPIEPNGWQSGFKICKPLLLMVEAQKI